MGIGTTGHDWAMDNYNINVIFHTLTDSNKTPAADWLNITSRLRVSFSVNFCANVNNVGF